MDRRTAVAVLSASAAIGLAGDYLFRAADNGIGLSVWIALLVASAIGIDRIRGSLTRTAAAWLVVALLFGAFLGLRDTPQLQAWNLLATLGCLVLALLVGRGLAIASTPLDAYPRPGIRAALAVVSAPMAALRPPAGTDSAGSGTVLRRSLIAVVVTVPLLLLFGSLFVSADPLFERLVHRVFAWDLEEAAGHVLAVGILAWLAAGYFIASRLSDRFGDDGRPNGRPVLGLLEVGVPMAAVTVLFASFVVLQFRYLFGGAELIRSTVGLSVAEYARRGFFELVAASGLVIPLVVAADWLLQGSESLHLRRFRRLAAAQLVLVGCIMVSALGRLRLYYESFGLTTDRLLALAVMGWIGLTLAWAAVTILREQRARFPLGAVVGGLGVLAGLNLLNPEAVVARANLSRHRAGESLDVEYLARMSTDAVPTILAQAGTLPQEERCPLVTELARRHPERATRDWREWNLGRERARQTLAERAPGLGCQGDGREPAPADE